MSPHWPDGADYPLPATAPTVGNPGRASQGAGQRRTEPQAPAVVSCVVGEACAHAWECSHVHLP